MIIQSDLGTANPTLKQYLAVSVRFDFSCQFAVLHEFFPSHAFVEVVEATGFSGFQPLVTFGNDVLPDEVVFPLVEVGGYLDVFNGFGSQQRVMGQVAFEVSLRHDPVNGVFAVKHRHRLVLVVNVPVAGDCHAPQTADLRREVLLGLLEPVFT